MKPLLVLRVLEISSTDSDVGLGAAAFKFECLVGLLDYMHQWKDQDPTGWRSAIRWWAPFDASENLNVFFNGGFR